MKSDDYNFSLMIRPVELSDAREINALRRLPGVFENLLALPSETIMQNEEFLARLLTSVDDHLFCAEVKQNGTARVIGLASLQVRTLLRNRHCADLGIMVHTDFHGQGVGRKLMETLIDLADNWLMLKRIELSVYPNNISAIKLYEKFGFVSEGTLKYASVQNGKYADVLIMARYCGVE